MRPPNALGELGLLLDRAVHRTFSRFAVSVPAFVLADALGGLLQYVPLRITAGPVLLFVAGMVLENRARVIVIASGTAPRGGSAAWRAALRHPAALLYALVGTAEAFVPLAVIVVAGAAVFVVGRTPSAIRGDVAFGGGFVLTGLIMFVVALLLVAAALLATLAAAAATFDTVLARTPPHRALAWWLRQAFRPRALGPTSAAAAIFILLVAGVPLVLGWTIPWGLPALRSVVFAIPEGIADAIALNFVWGWREAILESRHGRDIQALLDQADQPSLTVSPSASSPGVTTSQ